MAGGTRVFIVDKDHRANYKVFFVDQPHKEKNAQLIAPAVLVDREHQAEVKIFITDRDYKADVKIMRSRIATK
jgi:hypothetical protein